jgi:hypothetical protein
VDLKLCLRTNVWVAAGQALVAAITSEANRLLSLDLSSLEDDSQLPGRACYYSMVQTVNSVRSEVKTGDISPGVEGIS